MRVAFLGLGIMGEAMATNLVKAGHEVTVWNRTPGKLVEGAGVAPTPAAAAQGAEVVWLCVSDTDAVEAGDLRQRWSGIVADRRNDHCGLEHDFSLGDREIRGACRREGRGVGGRADDGIENWRSGRDTGIHRRRSGANIDRLKPLFAAMGKKIFRMGETGKGQATKLAMNLQIALIYEGFAEALTLATKLGVEPQQLLSLIEATMVRSGVVDYKGPFILHRDFTPNFPLRLMHKDIKLTLEAAKEARVKLPALETVEEIYEMATEDGHKDLDYAATLTLLEKWAGVQVKGKPRKSS